VNISFRSSLPFWWALFHFRMCFDICVSEDLFGQLSLKKTFGDADRNSEQQNHAPFTIAAASGGST
jgi:hypothetical protein